MSDSLVEAIRRELDARGSVTAADVDQSAETLVAIARRHPEFEPIYLVRFCSRQGNTRVEEVRAYAWPSQRMTLAHLGYRPKEVRFLRLEPRAAVPFPARVYARFAAEPLRLEQLRAAERAFERAVAQAPSKPGRVEREVLQLAPAFAQLGADLSIEMWLECATIFYRLDNPAYATRMFGHLLKSVERDDAVDESLLARALSSAADEGGWHQKLYRFTWKLVVRRHGVPSALGLSLRLFRRLLRAGGTLPTGFVSDIHQVATAAKVVDFEATLDGHILWASGTPAFWNLARKQTRHRDRDEATGDHEEVMALRRRWAALWMQASGHPDGESWKDSLWQRIRAVRPELSAYGLAMVVETLLAAMADEESSSRGDAERLLDGVLALLTGLGPSAPRPRDRPRFERLADAVFQRLQTSAPEVLWANVVALDEALSSASAELTSFVVLGDLVADASEAIGGDPQGFSLLRSLPNLELAWTAALSRVLQRTDDEPQVEATASDGASRSMPLTSVGPTAGEGAELVPLLAEAFARFEPATAGERLAELGPWIARRLAKDLLRDCAVEVWEHALDALARLGPAAHGIVADATRRFLAQAGASAALGHVVPIVHALDTTQLRMAAEARSLVDEAIEALLAEVEVPLIITELEKPPDFGAHTALVSARPGRSGQLYALWIDKPSHWSEHALRFAVASIDGAGVQTFGPTVVGQPGRVTLWATEGAATDGLFVVHWEGRHVQLLGLHAPHTVDRRDREHDEHDEHDDGHERGVRPLRTTLPAEAFGEDHTYGGELLAGSRHLLVALGANFVVLDVDLEVVMEGTIGGHGAWALLDAPVGAPLVTRVHDGRFTAIHDGRGQHGRGQSGGSQRGRGQLAPALNLPEGARPSALVRTADGGWFVAYQRAEVEASGGSSAGRLARQRLVQGRWVDGDDESSSSPWSEWVPATGRACVTIGAPYVFRRGRLPSLLDGRGRVGATYAPYRGLLDVLELRSGVGVFRDPKGPAGAWAWDVTLSARLAAAPLLEAARRAVAPGAPLDRRLFSDPQALLGWLAEQIAQRPGGGAALAALGPHRERLLGALVAHLGPSMSARLSVLCALDKPPVRSVSPSSWPPRRRPSSPPVRRAEVRRCVRGLAPPLDALAFWALVEDRPSRLVEHFFPRPEASERAFGAYSLGIWLLGLAQHPDTSRHLSERLVRQVLALVDALGLETRRWEVTARWDGPLESSFQRRALVLPAWVGATQHRVPSVATFPYHEPGQTFGQEGTKKSLPLRLSSGPNDVAVIAHLEASWAALGARTVHVSRAGSGSLRLVFEVPAGAFGGEGSFTLVVFAHATAQSFAWKLEALGGKAPLEVWERLFDGLDAALREAGCSEPWVSFALPRQRALEALRHGAEVTRRWVDRRRDLAAERWPYPAVAGIEEPKLLRLLTEVCLFGSVRFDEGDPNLARCEKLAKAAPRLVKKTWNGLCWCGQKTVPHAQMVMTTVARMREHVVLLCEPAELAARLSAHVGQRASTSEAR